MKRLVIFLWAGLTVVGCGGGQPSVDSDDLRNAPDARLANTAGPGPEVILPGGTPPNKVVIENLREGTGPKARPGDETSIYYVGVRWYGQIYSNSWTFDAPPSFVLGAHDLTIEALDMGIRGMREGGRRQIILPPDTHIDQDTSQLSPREKRNATLIFVVDLVKLTHGS